VITKMIKYTKEHIVGVNVLRQPNVL